jgi:hypothetical protein
MTEGEIGRASDKGQTSREWAPASADPRTAPKLADRRRSVSAPEEARLKADHLTPASPVKGCVDLPMTKPYSGSNGHGFVLKGEAMPFTATSPTVMHTSETSSEPLHIPITPESSERRLVYQLEAALGIRHDDST